MTWFRTDKAPYYPLSIKTQKPIPIGSYPSRESFGLSVDGGLEIGYAITQQMTLGAKAELHTGDDFREYCGMAFLRFALKGSSNLTHGD
jgi:hypothetical protein